MEKKVYASIEETIYTKTLSNGLQLVVYPKRGFTKSYAVFTTYYGSIDNHFQTVDGETHQVADGIAHFLEHKLFEKEEVDVMNTFNELGANTNAFTSFNQTSYLFSTTHDIEAPLNLLLDFVQEPFFSDESVEKEKGIIGEEIDMYNDDAGWRNYFGTIEQMYHAHPVKIDIAGTKETISKITKEQLYLCYHTFYHPSNMVLFVSGDVDVVQIENIVEHNQQQKLFPKPQLLQRFYPKEANTVAISEKVLNMDVTHPKVMFGLKLPLAECGYSDIQLEVILEILLEMTLGKGSKLNERYMKEQVILEPLGYEIAIESSYRHIIIGTDINESSSLKDVFLADFRSELNEVVEEDFIRIKHKMLGENLASLNSLEYIANNYTKYIFQGIDIFEIFEMIQQLRFTDVTELIPLLLKCQNTVNIIQK